MTSYLQRVQSWWKLYSSPGHVLRPTSEKAMLVIYGTWVYAFILKLIGSTSDVAWHFRYLRDDLAPPHNINTAGTIIVVGLVMFHTWTGFGVDRLTLRLMQAGIGTFLLAIPLDLLNHRLFGLDITAWSPTHAMLYLGTAIMLVGALRGLLLLTPASLWRTGFAFGLWAFLLEDILFPLSQQEYGVTGLDALLRGQPYAAPELIMAGGNDITRFAIPIPNWVYPLWIIAMTTVVLLAARLIMQRRWTATIIAAIYLVYRLVAFYLLRQLNFPPSFVPIFILGGAIMIDLAVMLRWHPLIAAIATLAAFYGGAWFTESQNVLMPPFPTYTVPITAALLACIWVGARWIEHSSFAERWRMIA